MGRLDLAFEVSAVNTFCNEVVRGYFCNYVYPGCEPGDGDFANISIPVGVCEENCIEYFLGERCSSEFGTLSLLGEATMEFRIPLQCEDRLLFVSDQGLDDFPVNNDTCLNISSKELV